MHINHILGLYVLNYFVLFRMLADPSGRAVLGVGLRLLAYWDCGFESVSCECCVLSGRGLCDELVPRPEESYRMWCVLSVIVKPRKKKAA
jgi:hypothetical protein